MKLGTIILWYGALVDIPQGWHVCDGTVGTPDLNEVFIIGAGDAYAVGDVGGIQTHRHTFTADGHNHLMWPIPFQMLAGSNYSRYTTVDPIIGTTDLDFVLPPWHALFYIQKMTPERPTEGY